MAARLEGSMATREVSLARASSEPALPTIPLAAMNRDIGVARLRRKASAQDHATPYPATVGASPSADPAEWLTRVHDAPGGPASASAVAAGLGLRRPRLTSVSSSPALDKSQHLIDTRCVSLVWVAQMFRNLLHERVVRDVRLIVARKELAHDVPAGDTLQVVHASQPRPGRQFGHARTPKRRTLVQFLSVDVKFKERRDWTVSDVCNFYIMPLLLSHNRRNRDGAGEGEGDGKGEGEGEAQNKGEGVGEGEGEGEGEGRRRCGTYLDLVPAEHVSEPFQGTFVSQARSCKFMNLLAALEAHFSEKGEARPFLWLDILCANQPALLELKLEVELKLELAQELELGASGNLGPGVVGSGDRARETPRAPDSPDSPDGDLLANGLFDAVPRFTCRVLYFESVLKPRCLERMWVIWEVFSALAHNAPLDIAVAPQHKADFLAQLLQSPRTVLSSPAEMDPSSAECLLVRDKKMIRSKVEATVGWRVLKSTVVEHITRWLLLVTEDAVRAQAEHLFAQDGADFGRLLLHAGELMFESGQLKVALSYFERSLHISRAQHADVAGEHEDCAVALSKMGNVFRLQDRFALALEHFKQSFGIYEKLGRADGLRAADVLNDTAVVHRRQGNLAKALAVFERCLALKRRVLEGASGGAVEAGGALGPSSGRGSSPGGALAASPGGAGRSKDRGRGQGGRGGRGGRGGGVGKNGGGSPHSHSPSPSSSSSSSPSRSDLGLSAQAKRATISVAATLNNQAIVLMARGGPGDLEQSRLGFEKSLDMFLGAHRDFDASVESREAFLARFSSRGHVHVASALSSLAIVYNDLGLTDKALATCERALGMAQEVHGTLWHSRCAQILGNKACILETRGELRGALRDWHRCFQINVSAYGTAEHTNTALALMRMARLHGRLGDKDDARHLAERAARIFWRLLSPEHPTARRSRALAESLGAKHDFAGEDLADEILATAEPPELVAGHEAEAEPFNEGDASVDEGNVGDGAGQDEVRRGPEAQGTELCESATRTERCAHVMALLALAVTAGPALVSWTRAMADADDWPLVCRHALAVLSLVLSGAALLIFFGREGTSLSEAESGCNVASVACAVASALLAALPAGAGDWAARRRPASLAALSGNGLRAEALS